MKKNILVHFKRGPLSYSDLKGSCSQDWGAECTFTGRVRKTNLGRAVVRLSYDIHQILAQAVITEIARESLKSQNSTGEVEVIHAFGDLMVGEISVLVRAMTPHRKEAFTVCRNVIDRLKHKAPIWKKEYYTDGDSGWLEGHSLCQHDNQHSSSQSTP